MGNDCYIGLCSSVYKDVNVSSMNVVCVSYACSLFCVAYFRGCLAKRGPQGIILSAGSSELSGLSVSSSFLFCHRRTAVSLSVYLISLPLCLSVSLSSLPVGRVPASLPLRRIPFFSVPPLPLPLPTHESTEDRRGLHR